MNLVTYDTINRIDYTKSWIDPTYRKLYSREIKYYNFYSFATRYNKYLERDEYYLILHNNINSSLKIYPLVSRNNICKIKLNDIWNKLFYKPPRHVVNINLEIDDIQEDCIVYYIDTINLSV